MGASPRIWAGVGNRWLAWEVVEEAECCSQGKECLRALAVDEVGSQ